MKASQLSEVILRFSFFGLVAITILIGIIGIKFLAIPLLISGIHFYIFHSIVDHLESRGVPRSATILLIFGFLISFAYWIVGFYLPGLFESAQPIIADWSQKMDDPNFQLIDFNKLPILSKNPELWKKIIKPEDIAKIATSSLETFLQDLVVMIPTFISWMIIRR